MPPPRLLSLLILPEEADLWRLLGTGGGEEPPWRGVGDRSKFRRWLLLEECCGAGGGGVVRLFPNRSLAERTRWVWWGRGGVDRRPRSTGGDSRSSSSDSSSSSSSSSDSSSKSSSSSSSSSSIPERLGVPSDSLVMVTRKFSNFPPCPRRPLRLGVRSSSSRESSSSSCPASSSSRIPPCPLGGGGGGGCRLRR